MNKSNKYKAISLFSGCGGMDLGFHLAGFETILANEIWKPACETFSINFPKTELLKVSISTIPNSVFEKYRNEVDVVFGGPPCQGFSQSGKQWVNDDRNYLFKEFLRVVNIVNPKYVLIENVPQILTIARGKFKAEIISTLERMGYSAKAEILNTAFYDVPQSRKRAIIIANRRGLPEISFPLKQKKIWTAQQAIGDLEEVTITETHIKKTSYVSHIQNEYQLKMRGDEEEVYGHFLPHQSEIDKFRIGNIKQGQSENSLPDFLKQKSRIINPKLKEISTLYRRLKPNRPSPTITKGVPQQPWHYKYNRRLTARELARIQSFPDRFIFHQNRYEDIAGQIGNSVPPLFAKALAEKIYKVIK